MPRLSLVRHESIGSSLWPTWLALARGNPEEGLCTYTVVDLLPHCRLANNKQHRARTTNICSWHAHGNASGCLDRRRIPVKEDTEFLCSHKGHRRFTNETRSAHLSSTHLDRRLSRFWQCQATEPRRFYYRAEGEVCQVRRCSALIHPATIKHFVSSRDVSLARRS